VIIGPLAAHPASIDAKANEVSNFHFPMAAMTISPVPVARRRGSRGPFQQSEAASI
jgi:hypothetical protein